MRRSRVVSSSIVSVGYDDENQILEVEFNEGRVYRYLDVPGWQYEELMAAESIGAYVNTWIKPAYDFLRA